MMRPDVAPIALAILLAAGCAAPREGEPEYVPPALRPPPADEGAARRPGGVTRVGAPRTGERSGGALDLEACLQLARENSRRLGIAERRVIVADDVVDETIAGALPSLTASGQYAARNNDAGIDRGGSSLSFQRREAYTGSISAIVPIYTFGKVTNLYEASSLGVDVASDALERERQALELAVRQGYFRVLEAHKIAGVVRQSIAVIERQLEIARDFLAQGLVAKNDVLGVEVQLAQRGQELLQAQNNVALARAALNRLLGLPIDAPTRLKDVLAARTWTPDLLGALRTAVDRRPDLAALRRQIEIAQAEYRATRADFFPRLFAFGSYNYTSDDYQLNQDWFSGGVGFEWSIFDGGATLARLRRQERLIDEAIDLRDERIDDVVLDVKQAVLRLQEATQRQAVARRAIDLADENLRITRDLYGQGMATSADVLRDEDRLAQARSTHFRTLYASHQAHAGLVFVVGADPATE